MMNDAQKNLGHAFREVARENRDFPAFLSEQRVLSYGDFWAITRRFAGRMRGLGVRRGSLIGVNTADPVVSLATLLASALLGARYIVASKVLAKARIVRPSHFLKSPDSAGSPNVPFEEIDESWFPGTGAGALDFAPDTAHEGFAAPEDDWLYLHTSGTTGQPKFICLSQRVVFDRTVAVASDFPLRATTMVSLFGYASRPFFARALGALLNACTIVDSMNPAFWREAGVNLLFASPEGARTFLADKTLDPKIARIEVSGARLIESDVALLLKSFLAVTDVYGASETSKTFANLHRLDPEGRRIAEGRPLDSTVEIIDSAGRPCPPGQVGSVRIRNGYMAPGYLGAPEATAKHFRDGWFEPGDFALWGTNGVLDVIGRDDDVVNIGGAKINALLVDLVIASVPGVRGAACFQNPKPKSDAGLLAFIEFEDGADRVRCMAEVAEICEARLGHLFAPRALRPIDRIPRNSDGAPQRRRCQELLLQGYHRATHGEAASDE